MAKPSSIPVWRHVGASPAPVAAVESLQTLIVGGGPVGLTIALDLARHGHKVTVLNKLDFVAAGSKAICFAKRTLDIWNRMAVGEAMVHKGVIWSVGKVFWGERDEPVYQFDLLPVKHQKMPGFINLQQYHVEEQLLHALEQQPNVEIRWGHEVTGLTRNREQLRVEVRCVDRSYSIDTQWLIACDGCKSPVREMLGLDFEGRIFEDNFLIADIKVKQARPAERWFWFDPPFNPGQSALLHKQPDDVWRLDFQLGWNIDRAACVRPENVEPLVRGMLGSDVQFTPEWYSVYTFQCRRMARFVHDRVIFAGDSAHLVSPFGARGCNGGVADADNLVWKLDLVLRGEAPARLLESYNYEAIVTADENILNSTRSTDFMTPKTRISRAFRDAVLELAQDQPFARPFVNSGRLSAAVSYPFSPLNTADEADATWSGISPGSPSLDAPTADGWLLDHLGDRFVLLTSGWDGTVPRGVTHVDVATLGDVEGLVTSRYDLLNGSAYLIRPDQYVAARWRKTTAAGIAAALARAKGNA
jgi:3-(3-hydroxy-phenyl)propionate hydroxylase